MDNRDLIDLIWGGRLRLPAGSGDTAPWSDDVVRTQRAGPRRSGGRRWHRGMRDAESRPRLVLDAVDQVVVRPAVLPDEVRGQRRVARAHRPDGQVMDLDHARQASEPRLRLVRVDAG